MRQQGGIKGELGVLQRVFDTRCGFGAGLGFVVQHQHRTIGHVVYAVDTSQQLDWAYTLGLCHFGAVERGTSSFMALQPAQIAVTHRGPRGGKRQEFAFTQSHGFCGCHARILQQLPF